MVNVMTKTSKALRSSDAELVIEIADRDSKWTQANQNNRDRLYEALGAFVDIEGGSWPTTERDDLISKGRHPTSFNIAHQKLNNLGGAIMTEKWDYEFLPMNGSKTKLSNGIKYWYYADKEQYNYTQHDNKCLMHGLMHCGYQKIDIRYDIRPEGAICFPCCNPGSVEEDPDWQTNDIRDWRRVIEHRWMTPAEMVEQLDINDPAFLRLAAIQSGTGEMYEDSDDLNMYQDIPYTRAGKYLVINYQWLERLKTTRLYVQMMGGFMPLPLDATESMVRDAIQYYGVTAEHVKEFPYIDNILYFAIVCPSISMSALLSKGRHPVQCGMIGYFPFSACRELGVKKGVMGYLLDIQRTFNFRHSKLDDVIASGAGGGLLVNKDLLGSGAEGTMDKIRQNRTRSDFVLGVNGPIKDAMGLIPSAEVHPDIWRSLNELVDMFDRVSPVTPSMEAASTPDESGVLFQMRYAVSKLGTLILYDNWQQHQMDKAEAWYNQAQIQYKGIWRAIKNTDTGEVIEFNSPTFRNGLKGYLNSVEDLPRSQVVITLSKASPTQKYAEQLELQSQMKILAAHPELFKSEIRVLINSLFRTRDLKIEEKEKIETLNQLNEVRDIVELLAQISTLKASDANAQLTIMQVQAMLQRIAQQQQQQQPMGGPQEQGEESFTPEAPEFGAPPEQSEGPIPTEEEIKPGGSQAMPESQIQTMANVSGGLPTTA